MIEHSSDPTTTTTADAVDADRRRTGNALSQPEVSGRGWIVSVFGDITRSGSWPPRRTTSPIALFGDIDLDFAQATMPAGEAVINAVAPFGNIDVVVPADSHVDVGGFALFGSKKVSVADPGSAETAPTIRVRGFTIFGSVKVSSR